MGKPWKALGRVIGWVGNAQTVYAILPAGVVSAVSGVSGYISSGLGWALFMASGAFAFVTLGIILIRENYRANRLEHKLTVTAVAVHQFPPSGEKQLYRPNFVISNSAAFELFFDVVDVDYVFGDVRGGLDKTTPLRGLLSPRETSAILVPAASGKAPLQRGRIRIRYGREKDEYTHELQTTLECAPFNVLQPEQEGTFDMTRLVQSLEYVPAA